MHKRSSTEKASFKYLIPLIKYLQKQKITLFIAMFLAMAGTVLTIIGPRFLSVIADLIADGIYSVIDTEKIVSIATFLIIIYVIAWCLSYLQGFLMNGITQKTAFGLRMNIAEKINKVPLKYFDNTLIGDILSRVTNDIDTIATTMNQSVGTLFQSGTQFLGVLVIMFITNWVLTFVALGTSVIGFVLMIFIMGKSQKYFVKNQMELGAINGHVEEIYAGHNVVKIYNAESKEKERFDSINSNLKNAMWRAQFLGGIMPPMMSFVGNFGFVCVCVIGSLMAMKGTITFGVVVAFMIYVRLFTNPLQQLGQVFTQFQSTAAASKRVFEFLDEVEMKDDSDLPNLLNREEVRGDIEFSHVKFGYNDEKEIIKDFSVSVKSGQKVAIVGPTGAGKTTLVNLLMRFYEVNSGTITVDGKKIQDMRREEIHDLFGMVLQDTWLFEGTIRDNIKYGKDVSDEVVINAAKTAGIHHFIMTMPKGYDTILNEEANVSAGQKQLLTIARAMVENAPFLILDEATSSVDTRTEELIQHAMDTLTKGRTSFIIAHRLSTIKNADLILVMNKGDIIEQGNHEQLIEQGGVYADLYNSQFENID